MVKVKAKKREDLDKRSEKKYTEDDLTMDIAKLFNLPGNLIWYEIKFGVGEVPRIRCECEVWADGDPSVVEEKIARIKREYEVHLKEVE